MRGLFPWEFRAGVPRYVKPDAWCSKLKEHATSDVVANSPEHLLEEVANYDKNFGRDT